ncbi:hypothetical protein GCM10010372_28640 [Streptomyces tauricus]|uniref:hypothetical protein n=1 Tax=Streptomyces tauricus TaxID=68274 RepID=UPI00199C5E2A|nr:hypothetical protein [Streptomyces tauricus]GHA27082.1 hypothetical protein GCM10010372_28640 [Streptomyces tauricus]
MTPTLIPTPRTPKTPRTPTPGRGKGARRRISPGRIAAWTLLCLALFVTVFPFYWMIRTALTPAADLYSDSTGLVPDHPTMINFLRVLGLTSQAEAQAAGGSGAHMDFLRYLLNSVVYSGLASSR